MVRVVDGWFSLTPALSAKFKVSPNTLTRPAATLSRSRRRGICREGENYPPSL